MLHRPLLGRACFARAARVPGAPAPPASEATRGASLPAPSDPVAARGASLTAPPDPMAVRSASLPAPPDPAASPWSRRWPRRPPPWVRRWPCRPLGAPPPGVCASHKGVRNNNLAHLGHCESLLFLALRILYFSDQKVNFCYHRTILGFYPYGLSAYGLSLW